MGLDYEHMIKVRAHKGGVRIGKTPKKLDREGVGAGGRNEPNIVCTYE
jgi:hypothetical protein